LVGLCWASDQIVPLWVLLPGMVLCLGLSGPARLRTLAAAVLAWIFRGLILWRWESQGMQVAHFRWAYFVEHAGALSGAAGAQIAPLLAAAFLPLAVALAAVGLLFGQARDRPLGAWLATALMLVALSGLGLAALQGSLQERYVMGFVWVGAPLLPLLASRFLGGDPLPLAASGLVGVLVCLGFFWSVPAPAEAVVQARWLDSQLAPRGLNRGLADYRHARPLRLLSGGDLVLLPATTGDGILKPFAWSVDRRIFDSGLRVQFVVLNGLEPAAVRAALGAPVGQADGAGLSLWFYATLPAPRAGI